VENVKMGAKEFYNLPIEEKMKFSQKEGDVEGYGQAFVMSEEQKLDWADMFFLVTLPPHMRKPHLFPKLPLPFRFSFSTAFLYLFLKFFVCLHLLSTTSNKR
jgi:isopenicillin N synthase-like dioxygenase